LLQIFLPTPTSRDLSTLRPATCSRDPEIAPNIPEDATEAARREKRLKSWCRKWKLNTIKQFNPSWRDLYEEISV
jgi:hypothetical protein